MSAPSHQRHRSQNHNLGRATSSNGGVWPSHSNLPVLAERGELWGASCPTKGTTRYTRVTVFRNAQYEATNGGVSSTHAELYVLDPQGEELKTPPDPSLVFRAEDRRGGYHALIATQEHGDKVGPMFGGNLACTLYGKDEVKTYRIHDRFETPEEYRALST